MEYRRLGKSGLPVSQLSFGSWITFGNQIENKISETLMDIAYEAGVNFFDNAEVYAAGQSEIVMGQILKKKNWSRDTYLVSSKVFFGIDPKSPTQQPTQRGLHRKHIIEACHQALNRLQVDYLDIYFCHRPDKQTPIEETVWTMHQLILTGKILYWGTSEWSAQEIMEANMVAQRYNLIAPVVEQPQYNMLVREKVEVEFNQIYKTVGLGTTIWSPLASGILTGKYIEPNQEKTRLKREELGWLADRLLNEHNQNIVSKLKIFSQELGITLPQLCIAWCLKNPNVSTVILGASKPEQLLETLKSAEVLPLLTSDVMNTIEEILQNKPVHPQF